MINFSMDFLSLYITGKALHSQIKPLRLASAAAIGALYATVSAVIGNGNLPLRIVWSALFIATAFAMCFVAFEKRVLKASLTFGAVNLTLGGTMTALFGFIERLGISAEPSSGGYSPLIFAAYAAISGVVSMAWGKFRKKSESTSTAALSISVFGEKLAFNCLVDSGNLLCDPISRKPVVIISEKKLGIISKDRLSQKLFCGKEPVTAYDCSDLKGFRIIPAKGVTGTKLLYGFIPDEITVNEKAVEAVVAIDSENESFGDFDGIVPEILI